MNRPHPQDGHDHPRAAHDRPEQVPPLSRAQIARFKRDGYLILEGVLDPEMCRQLREEMWDTIAEHLPRMKRDDPSTWCVTEDESERLTKKGGKDPYFSAKGSIITIRNGTEQLVLDAIVRPLWGIAEQLLGPGTIVPCIGEDAAGMTDGPCFISDDAVENLMSHMGDTAAWEMEGSTDRRAAPFETVSHLSLPKTGPVWLTGQGTRGHYLTLPSAKPADWRPIGHSDGPCYGPWRLQMMAYFDEVPPSSGAFTVWPGSHTRIWDEQWAALEQRGELHTHSRRGLTEKTEWFGGFEQILRDTAPVETHAPSGSVVLWHTKILHMRGHNTKKAVASQNTIRQGTIYSFIKAPHALSDVQLMSRVGGSLWRDWSAEVRGVDENEVMLPKL